MFIDVHISLIETNMFMLILRQSFPHSIYIVNCFSGYIHANVYCGSKPGLWWNGLDPNISLLSAW